MDQTIFKTGTQTLTRVPSRRDVLRGLVGAGLGLGSLRLAAAEAAKKKDQKNKKGKKRKGKKQNPPGSTPQPQLPPLVFNQYGCIDVGQPCRGDSTNCCSGICQGAAPAAGQPDTSRCVAHNTSICKGGVSLCSTGVAAFCNGKNPKAACLLTTGNASFCADFGADGGAGSTVFCRNCRKDTDCQTEFGPGAACVVYDGICSDLCATTGGTACMPAGDGAAITSAREVPAVAIERVD